MKKIPPGPKTIILNGIAVGEVMSTGNMDRDAEVVRQYLKDKGIYKETSLFQAMFNQAVAFANTSAYLYERDLKRSPRKGFSAAPFAVNATFSIELYIKALAEKHGAKLRGHELLKLHSGLPKAALQEIDAAVPICAPKRALAEAPDFLRYLSELNNAFVEWRYSYELEKTRAIHIESIIFVMEVLHEACRQRADASRSKGASTLE